MKDLEFAPNMDVALSSGEDLIEQRILVRLIMMRGWIYDTTGELGSNLYSSLSETGPQAIEDIPALVLEALSPMNKEIIVNDVLVAESPNEASLLVTVEYSRVGSNAAARTSRISFPLVPLI